MSHSTISLHRCTIKRPSVVKPLPGAAAAMDYTDNESRRKPKPSVLVPDIARNFGQDY